MKKEISYENLDVLNFIGFLNSLSYKFSNGLLELSELDSVCDNDNWRKLKENIIKNKLVYDISKTIIMTRDFIAYKIVDSLNIDNTLSYIDNTDYYSLGLAIYEDGSKKIILETIGAKQYVIDKSGFRLLRN